jgi:hypothetical protein
MEDAKRGSRGQDGKGEGILPVGEPIKTKDHKL